MNDDKYKINAETIRSRSVSKAKSFLIPREFTFNDCSGVVVKVKHELEREHIVVRHFWDDNLVESFVVNPLMARRAWVLVSEAVDNGDFTNLQEEEWLCVVRDYITKTYFLTNNYTIYEKGRYAQDDRDSYRRYAKTV